MSDRFVGKTRFARISREERDMGSISQNAGRATLSRRSFVGGSAAFFAALAAGSALASCSPQQAKDAKSDVQSESEGEWICAACWHNCGGRCTNRVLMKDGAVVRQGSDTSHEDSFEWIQQRGCPRGRSQQQQCFGVDRLKYPMKRKNWQPGGGQNSHGELRGIDEWERISWDEAISLMAQEIKRVYADYGAESVVSAGATGLAVNAGVEQVLLKMGGHVNVSDTSSCGVYSFNMTKLGLPAMDLGNTNDRFDLKNAETIAIMGGNSVWSSGGSTMMNFKEAKEAGVKFIMVGPSFNATAGWLDARWIPIYPGTDTAFLLGVAYEMIQQGVVDQEFLDKYCVGYDADHMPQDAKLDENFKDYVLGAYDATPKTAEWASSICGCTTDDVKFFAEAVGKDHKAMLFHNFALARCMNADNVPQVFMTVGAMGGHMGKSGHACGGNYKTFAGNCGPQLVNPGKTGLSSLKNEVPYTVSAPLLWQSILDGEYNSTGKAYGDNFNEKTIRQWNVKYLSSDAKSTLQNIVGAPKGIEAIRSLDFVTATAQFLNAQAKYADIVLPVTTEWERVGGFPSHQRSRETLIVYTQVTEPLYEAKTDQEIGTLLAEALGLDPAEMWPNSEKQQFFNAINGATYLDEQGEAQPLVTITEEDISAWECDGTVQEGVVGLDDFLKNGNYTIQRKDGDGYGYIGYKAFVEDPEKNPLKSDSGKFEIYCDYKSDMLNSMGYSPDGTFKPYANYVAAPDGEGREGMFEGGVIGAAPSAYPYIVYNPHYLRRAHPVLDNAPWLREAWSNPVFLNEDDAAAKGIKNGDTVRVFNAHGAVLRQASLTQILMPGCVGLPHGAWLDWDDDKKLDKAGHDNVLCGSVTGGMGTSGYNNYTCDYELYDGEPLKLDCELEPRIVEFA